MMSKEQTPRGVYPCFIDGRETPVYIKPDMGYKQCFGWDDPECTQLAKTATGSVVMIQIRDRFGMLTWPFKTENSPAQDELQNHIS